MTSLLRRFRASAASAVSVAALAVALTACGGDETPTATDSPTPTPTPTAAPTVGTYPAYALSDYDFTVRVSCFCADIAPVRVEVRDGKAISAVYLHTGRGHHKGDAAPDYRMVTIQDIIDAANDTEAAKVDVTWPADQDYPTSVYVDQDEQTVDEEIGYSISNVTPAG